MLHMRLLKKIDHTIIPLLLLLDVLGRLIYAPAEHAIPYIVCQTTVSVCVTTGSTFNVQ